LLRYPPIAEMYGPAQSAQVCPPGGLKILNSRSLHYFDEQIVRYRELDTEKDSMTYDDREVVKFVRYHTIDDIGERI